LDFKLPDVKGNYPKGAKAIVATQPQSASSTPKPASKPKGRTSIDDGEEPTMHKY